MNFYASVKTLALECSFELNSTIMNRTAKNCNDFFTNGSSDMASLRALFSIALAIAATVLSNSSALAFDGLVVSDLPPGGDVTVPGDYPIMVPRRVDVMLTGVNNPQSITLTNTTPSASVVQIHAMHEHRVRTITIQPGTSAVYSFKNVRPVRVKVVSGDVRVNSIHPLKVQR